MRNHIEDEIINGIKEKLCKGDRLNNYEIHCVVTALMQQRNCKQEPYYEVIYHDEYDRQESRIMNPISVGYKQEEGYFVKRDRFELNFDRIVLK